MRMGSWTGGCRVRLEKGLKAFALVVLDEELPRCGITSHKPRFILDCVIADLVSIPKDRNVFNGPGLTLRRTRPCLIGVGMPGHQDLKATDEIIHVLLRDDGVDAALPWLAHLLPHIGLVGYDDVEICQLIPAASPVTIDALVDDIVGSTRHNVPGEESKQRMIDRVD